MIKLTDKCLDAFGDKHAYDYKEFMELPESCKNALIIDFFDSVGIKIGIDPVYDMQGTYRAYVGNFGFQSMYRNVAIENAIIKANFLFNEK